MQRKTDRKITLALSSKESHKQITLGDRISCRAKSLAFITLKTHNEDFRANLTCRLICPRKDDLGNLGNITLEEINFEEIEV